jgi:hypothetical protein
MPTFIDESGDTGHEPDSSRYFRLAAVWVPTNDAVEAFRCGIRQLRQNLGLAQTYEFKFARSSSHPKRREAFFRLAMEHDFRSAAVSVNKRHEV